MVKLSVKPVILKVPPVLLVNVSVSVELSNVPPVMNISINPVTLKVPPVLFVKV